MRWDETDAGGNGDTLQDGRDMTASERRAS